MALLLQWYVAVRLTDTHLAIGSRLEICVWIILLSSLKLLKFLIFKGYIIYHCLWGFVLKGNPILDDLRKHPVLKRETEVAVLC